jgi:hypothetical protein
MEQEVTSQTAAQTEREWELADEDLDRPTLHAYSSQSWRSPEFCGVYRGRP